ncbi:hypothetical protein YTPLAS21_14340 [Candidatus Nitrosocosmicus sp.]|nr:hypothetical protein YTPLAS21_14340 [Candidatus Nitrosocosmicus sp.]
MPAKNRVAVGKIIVPTTLRLLVIDIAGLMKARISLAISGTAQEIDNKIAT